MVELTVDQARTAWDALTTLEKWAQAERVDAENFLNHQVHGGLAAMQELQDFFKNALRSDRRAEAVGGAGAEEAFLEWLHHERGWWHGEDFPLLKEGFLAGWAARGGVMLTPAELRTLYDLAFGHDPADRWDEATEALRTKLRGLVGE